MTSARPSRAFVVCSGLTVLAAALLDARADRLHLEGGGKIDVRSWWVEGTQLYYDAGSGTVGLPRSMVLRIDAGTAAPAAAAASAPAAAKAAPERSAAAPIRVRSAQRDLLEQGRRALEAGEYASAAAAYEELLGDATLDPDLQTPRIGYAVAQLALGEDALAEGAVLDGLARDPREPVLLELLGDLRNRAERVRDALAAWSEAFELAPADRLRQKIEKAERELHAGGDYDLRRSSHFNLRHAEGVDPRVTEAVLEQLEGLYWHLAEELDHAPPQPITVLFYPEQEFRDVTQAADWVAGLFDGKIRVPLGGKSATTAPARALLAHELTHAVVHSKSRGRCPRWLHEGLAQRFEGRSLGPAERREIRNKLQAAVPERWEDAGFSYPLALSLTTWLVERRGLHAVIDLLELLGDGRPIDEALVALYGEPYAGLCRRWAAATLEEVEP